MTAEQHPELRSILKIDKNPKPIILIGGGESVNKLNIDALKNQYSYDICTISDAMKIPILVKYAFQYHWKGIWRCEEHLRRPQILITNYKILHDLERVGKFPLKEKVLSLENTYYFQSNHINWDNIENGKFDRTIVEPRLQNHEGSVVGVIHFLVAYLGVKKIRYIGFDGGNEEGSVKYNKYSHHGRKGSVIEGASKDYYNSWKAAKRLLRFYKDVSFKSLREFLKGE